MKVNKMTNVDLCDDKKLKVVEAFGNEEITYILMADGHCGVFEQTTLDEFE